MAQEGFFIITTPEALAEACKGWSKGLDEPDRFTGPNVFAPGGPPIEYVRWMPRPPERSAIDETTNFEAPLEVLQPVCEEVGIVGALGELCSRAPVRYYLAFSEEYEVCVFECDDDKVSEVLASWPAMKAYADSEVRHAVGLRCYLYVPSC